MRVLKSKRAILCFLLPALIVYTAIVFLPISESVYYSLFKWNGVSAKIYIGADNYLKLFSDRVFRQALGNNLKYIVYVVFVQIGIGFLVAIMLTYVKRFREIIRTMYYIPSVITVVAIAQLFRCFYSYDPVGLINLIRMAFHVQPIAFLSDYRTALFAVSMVEGWQYIGVYMIIFFAALIAIPADIEESGRIDGANETQLLIHIKLPFVLNVVGLALILSLVGALRGFAAPMLLTHGGPANQTEILATYMYKKAFLSAKLGYGSTIAVIIAAISLLGVLAINRVTNKTKE